MKTNFGRFFLLLCLAAGVLTGCSKPSENPLASTEWRLVSLNGKDLIPETSITASFTNKEIVGSSGCNRYSAIVEETDNTINFPDNEAAVTDRGCLTPDGVMEQEKEYIAVLLSVTTFSVSDGQLEMKNGDGDVVLIFE